MDLTQIWKKLTSLLLSTDHICLKGILVHLVNKKFWMSGLFIKWISRVITTGKWSDERSRREII